ncbi:hypothetical protein chiPu_0007550 [Chiloscyllium punctatum]|uniref:Uncharacterized protein n=1 Tax=Chiloscyllium punctatum TaxID=137246 RepID=A0A401SFI4_CHIPU|nr:hypothetical protein [Chiloscyllium punctatum]
MLLPQCLGAIWIAAGRWLVKRKASEFEGRCEFLTGSPSFPSSSASSWLWKRCGRPPRDEKEFLRVSLSLLIEISSSEKERSS